MNVTTQDPETILVYVGLDLMGDGLMKLPFVRALRNAFPDARITWLAGKGRTVYAHELQPLVAPFIDEVIEDADIGGRTSRAAGPALAGRRFDLIIDTQRRVSTTLAIRRINHRRFVSGCARYLFSSAKPPWALLSTARNRPAMIDQMLELVALARHGRTDAPLDTAGTVALPDSVTAEARRLLPGDSTYVALAPGAGDRVKCWPLENFSALGTRLLAAGPIPVYVLGPGEADWHGTLRDAVPGACFPLQESAAEPGPLLTIAVAARCGACVANDSGGGHLLAASGTPLVSLFGPTPPAKFAPRVPHLTVIEAGHYGSREMRAIPVDAVEAAVRGYCSG